MRVVLVVRADLPGTVVDNRDDFDTGIWTSFPEKHCNLL